MAAMPIAAQPATMTIAGQSKGAEGGKLAMSHPRSGQERDAFAPVAGVAKTKPTMSHHNRMARGQMD
jgi:hypothetical protein